MIVLCRSNSTLFSKRKCSKLDSRWRTSYLIAVYIDNIIIRTQNSELWTRNENENEILLTGSYTNEHWVIVDQITTLIQNYFISILFHSLDSDTTDGKNLGCMQHSGITMCLLDRGYIWKKGVVVFVLNCEIL